MPTPFWISLFLLGTLLLFLYGAWMLIPVMAGLPWRATQPGRIRKALHLAGLKPGEVVYDLGCGDGRVLVLAAREFKARAVGVEVGRLQCLAARFNAWINQVGSQVSVRQEDFYKTGLGGADVVFAYMTSRQVERLRPHLEAQLRQGARVVTISFDMEGWEPQQVDSDELIFVYRMPPQAGNLETYLEKKY